jgi:hypothetical protein
MARHSYLQPPLLHCSNAGADPAGVSVALRPVFSLDRVE